MPGFLFLDLKRIKWKFTIGSCNMQSLNMVYKKTAQEIGQFKLKQYYT